MTKLIQLVESEINPVETVISSGNLVQKHNMMYSFKSAERLNFENFCRVSATNETSRRLG